MIYEHRGLQSELCRPHPNSYPIAPQQFPVESCLGEGDELSRVGYTSIDSIDEAALPPSVTSAAFIPTIQRPAR